MEQDSDIYTDTEARIERLLHIDLPLSRVKKICRLDPELSAINYDAVLLVTKATELFVEELAKTAYTQAVLDKRKTIQLKDIDRAIGSKWMFRFLEDALNDWPEPTLKTKKPDTIVEEDDINPEVAVVVIENDKDIERGMDGQGMEDSS
uniref:CBFD_NFYB_HMF domain-containing protein n=1 Tax=Heterorhabditis bacteriophora TaxID=37862 RepID=A0A1I7XTC1_HETBA